MTYAMPITHTADVMYRMLAILMEKTILYVENKTDEKAKKNNEEENKNKPTQR